jgi:hypothetical protein
VKIACQIVRRSSASCVDRPSACAEWLGSVVGQRVGNYDVHDAMYNDPFDGLARTIVVQTARKI